MALTNEMKKKALGGLAMKLHLAKNAQTAKELSSIMMEIKRYTGVIFPSQLLIDLYLRTVDGKSENFVERFKAKYVNPLIGTVEFARHRISETVLPELPVAAG